MAGIDFQTLHLKDRVQFKDQSFDLSRKGVSLILGYNQKTGSNNGVGKSLFFGELADFLTEDVSTGTKADKSRKGSVMFSVKKNADLFEFERSFSPREKITITKNGEDIGVRELSVAREIMRTIVPYGEQEVHSFLYLDGASGAHPLIEGSTASRKEFFRSFFKSIDSLEPIRKLVDSHADSLKDASRRLVEVTNRITDLRAEVPSNLEELREEMHSLESQRDEIQTDLALVMKATSLSERINELSPSVNEELINVSLAELSAYKKETRAEISRFEKLQDELIQYEDWLSENSSLQEELEAAEKVCSNIGMTLEEMTDKESHLSEQLETHSSSLKDMISRSREYVLVRQELLKEIERLEHKASHLQEESGKCPTCGGEYNNKDARKELASVKKTLAEKNEELNSLTKPSKKAISQLERKIESAKAEISTLTEGISSINKRNRLLRRLDSRPQAPDVKKSLIDSKLRKLSLRKTELEAAEDYVRISEEWKSIPSSIRRKSKGGGIHKRFVEINDRLSELRVLVSHADSKKKDISSLRAEQKELRLSLTNEDCLQVLQQAFSKRGVEREMISSACQLLSEQVNKYAKILFAEDFHFNFDMESSNFRITVERNYLKRKEVSDVRKLSGAEKRLFSLVLMISLLVFIPAKDRPNILILDEPTATMGEDNKQNFVRFLPILNSVVPHIIVITPLKPQDYNHLSPMVYTVVKNNHRSTFQEGIVDDNSIRSRNK